MMLLKKIPHLVKDVKENIIEIINLKNELKDLKQSILEKDKEILELKSLSEKHTKEINILANDVLILANFAKEVYSIWEYYGNDEFDLFDLYKKKEKKKNNYH